MLQVTGLTRKYNSVTAVDGVSFVIQPGEVFGYLGPNGSGKTTTVKMLIGLLEPTAGGIFFEGRNIRRTCSVIASASATFRRNLTFIPT